jgi:transcriptional regulator with XRE-family HTH domain
MKAANKPDPAQTLGKATLRASAQLGLSQKDLAAVLGISEATASRLARGRAVDPKSKEGELALLLLRVYRSLSTLVGGQADAAREWMHAANDHLRGTPATLARTTTGLVAIADYLDGMRGKL